MHNLFNIHYKLMTAVLIKFQHPLLIKYKYQLY